jgi:histidinol phosphatase-like PHP family hydrolase
VSNRSDIHIHTKYLGCANETMELSAIARECERLGVECIGIADHLNTPEQLELHRPILSDIRKLQTDVPVYLGVELNFTKRDGGLVFDREIKQAYGFQFAIGGIHATYVDEFDLSRIIEIQHRHHLSICRNELVDVLVHPYWFSQAEFDKKGFPAFGSVRAVPERLTRELGRAASQTRTAIEINSGANLANRPEEYFKAYVDYLTILAEEGVMFAVGSDAHGINQLERVRLAWEVYDRLGLPDERLWRPAGAPVVGRGSAPAAES